MKSVTERAPFSAFVKRTSKPSRTAVRGTLGAARAAWDGLEAHMAETYGLRGSFHFMYGARYGWALRFGRGGRFVLAMYPNKRRLTVQIILSRAQIAAAAALDLPARVSAVIESAKDYPEGRWLYFMVRSRRAAEELRPLIALKGGRPAGGRVAGRRS